MVDSRPSSANRILDTALELFATRGYEGTTVREICDAACITKPTLYYFYGSKEGVFRALVHGAMDEMRRDLEAALRTPGPIVEALRTIARNFFAEASRRRTLWRVIASNMWLPDSSHVKELFGGYCDYHQILATALDAAVARGELTPGPTDIRLMVLLGGLSKALDHYLLFGEPPLTMDLADRLIDVAVCGWLPQTSPSTSPSSVALSSVALSSAGPSSPAPLLPASPPSDTPSSSSSSSSSSS